MCFPITLLVVPSSASARALPTGVVVVIVLDAPGVRAVWLVYPRLVSIVLDVEGVVALMVVPALLLLCIADVPGVVALMVVWPVTGSRVMVAEVCAVALNAAPAQAAATKLVRSFIMM